VRCQCAIEGCFVSSENSRWCILKIGDCSENTTVPLASSAFQNIHIEIKKAKPKLVPLFFSKKNSKKKLQQVTARKQSRKRNCQITDNKIQNNVQEKNFSTYTNFQKIFYELVCSCKIVRIDSELISVPVINR
jgi:hypothetical protein